MANFILKSNCDALPEPPESSVATYVLRRIQETAGDTSQIINPATGGTVKYLDFDALSCNVAHTLREKYGFRNGDTLIYSAHDGAQLHVFLLGVWRAGGVVRSSYPEDTQELLERIKESNAKFLLCDESQALNCSAIVREIPWNINVIVFGNGGWAVNGFRRANEFFKGNFSKKNGDERSISDGVQGQDENSIALVLPTSGTTGKSKGAVYSHKTVIKTLALLETLPLNDDPSRWTLFLGKQTHVSGCLIALARICSGHSLLMMTQVTTPAIVEAVGAYRPRSLFLFPKFLTELVQHQREHADAYDLSCVHFVTTAGMIVTPTLVETAKKLPNLRAFMMCYGMTECGLFTTNVDWISKSAMNNNRFTKPICDFPAYSCGKLVPGASLVVRAIVNDGQREELNNNDTGTIEKTSLTEDGAHFSDLLGPGQLGELYFKSDIAFEGYLNKPEQTTETLSVGWIRTGDLGYYDQNGFVYVTDRVKETFKYFNNHISPTELEHVILGHEAVAEACVLGIPDPAGGDMIARAFVVLKSSVAVVNADEIKEFANNLLPSYKQLKGGLFIIPKLPTGKTGKLCRDALKRLEV